MIIKAAFTVPPYPAGITSLIQDLERQFPKAKGVKPEEVTDSRLERELDQSGFVKALLAGR